MAESDRENGKFEKIFGGTEYVNFGRIQNEVHFTAVRGRGPGGQNVNKVSSSAVLFWDYRSSMGLTEEEKNLIHLKMGNSINKEGQVFLRSDEFRDLEKNKNRCLDKLRSLLTAAVHKPKHRR